MNKGKKCWNTNSGKLSHSDSYGMAGMSPSNATTTEHNNNEMYNEKKWVTATEQILLL